MAFPSTHLLENPSNPGHNGDNVAPLDGWNAVYPGISTWQRKNAHYAPLASGVSQENSAVAMTCAAWQGIDYSNPSDYTLDAPMFIGCETWATLLLDPLTDIADPGGAFVFGGGAYVTAHIDALGAVNAYPYDEGIFGGVDGNGNTQLFYQDFLQTRPYATSGGGVIAQGDTFGIRAHPAQNRDSKWSADLYVNGVLTDTLNYLPNKGDGSFGRDGGIPGFIGIATRGVSADKEVFSQIGGGMISLLPDVPVVPRLHAVGLH